MKSFIVRLSLALLLFVTPVFAGTGAPFTAQMVQGISSPQEFTGLAAWYDVADTASMVIDGSNRVQLIADKSGNSSVNVLALNGVAGNYASSPDSVAVSITGDIRIDADIQANDYTPTGNQVLVAKGTSVIAANLEYLLQLNTGGTLTLYWSTGAATLSATSTAAVSFTDLARGSVQATLDVNDGSGNHVVKFYTGTTFGTWSQLGSTITTAGTTSIQNSTNAIAIGSFTGGASGNFNGLVYRARITNGYDGAGTVQFDANFATFSKLATSGTESSSNAATVTINTTGDLGARICGARDLVQMTASKMPQYLAWSGTNYGYLNGVAANYFSTPSSAGLNITGDIELIWRGSLVDWTPSTAAELIVKGSDSSAYRVRIETSGAIGFFCSSGSITTATVIAPSFTDGSIGWIKVTRVQSTGLTSTYFSSNGTTWTLSGQATIGAGSPLGTNASDLNVGRAFNVISGNSYYASVANAVDGAPVSIFNPALYTSGTTFTASTGETWTLNGGSTIVTRTCLYFDGSNDYMKAASFAQPQPVTRLTVGSHVTWTSGDYLWDGASAANTGALIQTTTTPQLNLNAGSSVAANTDFTLNTQFIFTEVINGASSSLQANKLTATTGSAGAGVPNGITIGASGASTAANFANITFSERVSYS